MPQSRASGDTVNGKLESERDPIYSGVLTHLLAQRNFWRLRETMAKKKAELEREHDEYRLAIERLRVADSAGDYEQALTIAVSAWKFVDGMMQYERRFEDRTEHESLLCINYVVRTAPLLFAFDVLGSLRTLLATQKRIDKNTSADLSTSLQKAFVRMNAAHRLWDYIEREVHVRQDRLRATLQGDQDEWRWIAEQWQNIGLIRRHPDGGSYILSLVTRMEDEVRAKCSSCGVVARAAKGRFWEQISCPKCKDTAYFVILSDRSDPG